MVQGVKNIYGQRSQQPKKLKLQGILTDRSIEYKSRLSSHMTLKPKRFL